jgi:cellulose synthase/poly-beta-1,6-N-acetylglucosamine synthase-like glycosyltransferase
MLTEHIFLYAAIYFGLFMASYFFIVFFTEDRKDPPLGKFRKKLPKISVLIPAYNEEKVIVKTIMSCLNLNYPKKKLEIIVIDDGSTDKTYKEAKKIRDSRLRVFRKKNGGKGSALNYGIRRAHGEFISSLDADSFVSKGALKKMLGYFNDEKVMSVTPALNVYKPKTFMQRVQYAEYAMSIFLRKIFGIVDAQHVVPGPFSIYRKSFLNKYGLFDEHNLTEDTEMALRIQYYHYKIKNSMYASVQTVAPKNFKGLLIQRMRWYYGFTQNALRYKQLFSTKYGDLGVCVLPAAILAVVSTAFLFFYTIYKNIIVLGYDSIVKLQVLNVNVLDALLHSDPRYIREFFVSLVTNPFIAFMILSAVIIGAYLLTAKKATKDKENMAIAYVYFFLTYWFLYPFWWMAAFIYRGAGGKLKWGKQKH